jgi:hypothetical protein
MRRRRRPGRSGGRRVALQHAGAFQLLQHAVQGRLGQAGFLDQALQRQQAILAGDDFQQREQAQGRRVAVDGRRLRRGGRSWIHVPKHSP